MMCDPILRLLFILMPIFSIFVFFQVNGIQEQVGTLPQDQVSGVGENANEFRNKDWNFSMNPCHTPSAGKPRQINSSVVCNYPSNKRVFGYKLNGIQAQVRQLPPNEVSALREIAKELRKMDWDFNLNPCDGNINWKTPLDVQPSQFNNSVICDCSPDGVCHVTEISLKGQNLSGVLPISLAKLPSLKHIDLSFNYLNGTIPKEWASTRLEFLSVTGNRLSGSIPTSFGKITTLRYFRLENNMFSGKVPTELGNLTNITNLVLSANNLSGELPMELNSLTNLIELRLSSNNFSGKIPNLGNCTKIQILEIQGSGVEGPIPASLSHLRDLDELRISDLSGEGSRFPDLSSIKSISKLMLRSCNISGTIPDYISEMSNLNHLDLSFNNLGGEIPDLSGLNLNRMFLSGNSLNGSVPRWIIEDRKRVVDLSYNQFSEASIPTVCYESLNLFRSYIGWNNSNSDLARCLSSCSKEYYSVNINCGGQGATIGKKYYEADQDRSGPAHFFPSGQEYWGISNTGSKWDSNDSDKYIAPNTSILTMNDSQLYTTARHSPLSLTYYGRCLANGNYTVTLHFAEIVFTDNQSYKGLGRRIFDVYVQVIR